jgi:ribonuclease HI
MCIQGLGHFSPLHNGYSIDGESTSIIESGLLPNDGSAQTCKLFALNQALKHLKDKEGTIYTDSKNALGVVHTFGKIWMKRGLINSKGEDLVHGELIQQILA